MRKKMSKKILVLSLMAASALFTANASAQQCNGVTIDSVRAGTEATLLTTSGPGSNCGFNSSGFVCISAADTRIYAAALTAQASGSTVTIAFDTVDVGCGVDGSTIPRATEIRVLTPAS